MSRIKYYAKIAGRTLTQTPLPDWAYGRAFGKIRLANPGTSVSKKHAIITETVQRTRVVWLDQHKASNGLIVYIHGGGFSSGPYLGDWEWLSQQADAREAAGLLIDYRYGPDYVHPTALEDCLAVLDTLDLSRWVLVGHQSGAALALATANKLSEQQQPQAIVLMNAWLDLELSNLELATETGAKDPVHERKFWCLSAQKYAGRTPLDDPDLSPVNGSLEGSSPVHYSVGTKDLFLTDARVMKLQLEQAGRDVTYREIGGRISVNPRLRRGADMERLQREQAIFIERALG